MAAEGVDTVAHGVAEEAQLDRLGAAGVVLEYGRLEVLPDDARIGISDGEHGTRRVIEAGVGLGMAERLETAELDEEVQEAGGRAVDSHVGHAVTPGAEGQADLVADEVGLCAQVGRVARPPPR